MGEVGEGEGDDRRQRVWEYDDMVAMREGLKKQSRNPSAKGVCY